MLKVAKVLSLKIVMMMIPGNKNNIIINIFLFQVPRTKENWKILAQRFGNAWNFDNCIGAVDGKHITLQKPEHSGSYYYNYKGTYSIVLMGIANANYEFIMVDVGTNGRVSDRGIPEPEELPNTNKKMPFVFVGDEAFQLLPNFMKPYNKQVLNDNRRIFNYRLSRARRIIENVFGILASRFKIFQKHIKLSPRKAKIVVMACCHLHNLLMKQKNYVRHGKIDVEDFVTGAVIPGTWRNESMLLGIEHTRSGNSATLAKQVRDDFCEYLNTTGAVPWQKKCLE
ncbi:unnamed protein product [Pieris macdunnoughi]|uniref:DDE Tnp4 domain-containing protein n=1 Tax=Pieris macdunnoughi TaxID=345717 RepID=A0A821L4F3_9NEOP|nr:unnamed protein product [Pieris macdunnoughi]